MKYWFVVFIVLSMGLIGCERGKNAKQSKASELAVRPTRPLQDKKLIHKLIDSALSMGNETAYSTVSTYYFIEKQEQDFFYYAFTMANKYNNARAYYDVYMIIAYSTPENPKTALQKIDGKTRNFAMYYLLKSYEMGHDQAKYEMEKFFTKDEVIPKSSLYLQKFCSE